MTPLEELPPPEEVLAHPHGYVSDRPTQPPRMGPPQVTPSKKRRSPLLVIVIIAILLCCCGVGAGIAGLGWLGSEEADRVTPVAFPTAPTSTVPPVGQSDAGTHDEAWNAFSPEIGSEVDLGDERQMRLASDIADANTPGFSVTDVRVEPGGQDEDGYFIADHYLMRLVYDLDPSIELAYETYVATEEWVEAGESWDLDSLESWEVHAVLPDGTEYTYSENLFPELARNQRIPGYLELLAQVAKDWPGGVNAWVMWYDDADGLSAWVYPTTWESYIDPAPFEGFEAGYFLGEEGWEVVSWEPYSESGEATSSAK